MITNSKLGWNICQAMCRVYAGLLCTYILITKNKSFTLIDMMYVACIFFNTIFMKVDILKLLLCYRM